VPNCCHNDEECDDGDDLCTDDACIDDQCVLTYTGAEGCCKTNADCKSTDPCQSGVCKVAAGTCTFQPIEGCCHDDAECDDLDDVCTLDTCVANTCQYAFTGAPGCCEVFTWAKDFNDSTPQGFTFNNGFSLPLPGFEDMVVGWNVTGDCGTHSDPAAMYYGSAGGLMGAGCTYTFDLGIPLPIQFPNNGTATSEQFTLPEGQTYTMTFWVMADVGAAANGDELKLEVLSGSSVVEVWNKTDLPAGSIGATWNEVTVDLSDYAGKTASLRFSFDALGATATDGVGILVDDIAVNADCNP
jgi:hypothetical protein